MEDICDDFKRKNQPAKGALLPAEHGAIVENPGKRTSITGLPTFQTDLIACDPGIELQKA